MPIGIVGESRYPARSRSRHRSLRRPARQPVCDPAHPREVGLRADPRARPHARRADRARRHQLAEPPVRHAARHRAPHGRAVPRRARHRSVRRRPRPGADHAAAARPARAGRLLPCRSPISRRWRRRCGRRFASCGWPASTSDDLQADAFESPAKHAELCALLAAYEQFLRTSTSAATWRSVYEEAVQHPDWCPIQPQDCWTELPDADWNAAAAPADRRACRASASMPRALALPGASIPRRLRRRRASSGVSAGPRDQSARVPDDAAAASRRARRSAIDLFHAGGREAEIEEVFRRILAAGVTARSGGDRVRVGCARRAGLGEGAAPRLAGHARPRHRRRRHTRPGRALIGLCDWIETDFAAGHLRRLLQSGDIGVDENDDGFTRRAGGARCSRAPRPAGDAPPTASRSGACAKSYEARAADPDAVGRRPRGRAGARPS